MRKGQRASKETLERMSITSPKVWLGKKFSEEHRKKISEARKGFKMSKEQKLKIRESRSGSKHPNWKGGVKLENQRFRVTSEYREFIKKVLDRDKNHCKINNTDCSGPIEVHHILNSMDYPELRYDTNNGITLCQRHHPRGRKKEEELKIYFRNLLLVL